jgi:hypothetical protein
MPTVASGAVDRAQAIKSAWPPGSFVNVASATALLSSSIAHAASVALWVSTPIAVMSPSEPIRWTWVGRAAVP